MAVTLGFLWAFAKIDAYSHFTVLILISWLKFKTTSKMTTEEQKEPERWRQQEQELRKKGILSKNDASTRAFEARYMVPPLSQDNESDKWPTSLRGWGNWLCACKSFCGEAAILAALPWEASAEGASDFKALPPHSPDGFAVSLPQLFPR